MTFRGDLFHPDGLLFQNVVGTFDESSSEPSGSIALVLGEEDILPRDGQTLEVRAYDGRAFTIVVKTLLLSDSAGTIIFKLK